MRRYHASPRNSQITHPKIRVAIYRANLCNPQTIYPGFTGRFARKGAQIAPKGVADLLLEGKATVSGPAAAGGHRLRRNSRKALFFAEQKIRPKMF
jgi:hypothetical protein